MLKKVLFVFGTRPEAIKLAPVIDVLRKSGNFNVKICVTGQHREMLQQVLELFDIFPDYNLDLMRINQSLAFITSSVLNGVTDVIQSFRPNCVMVQGDTTTAMAAALAAFYKKTRVCHIEAGLRTGDMQSPWPEELNRVVCDKISSIYFAPTWQAQQNLIAEGVAEENVFITGNTVIDALFQIKQRLETDAVLLASMDERFPFLDRDKRLILVTGHRRENFGKNLESICLALRNSAETHQDVQFVYPVHMNPNIRLPVNKLLGNCSNVFLLEPQDYLSFVYLMFKSHFIVTDSGGIQEEAAALGKPVLVTRANTERMEAVDAGAARLIGIDKEAIVREINNLLVNESDYSRMSQVRNLFGDGKASQRILHALTSISDETVNYKAMEKIA